MQYTSQPNRIPLPFAQSGGRNTIPQSSQIPITPGAASLTDGFPPLTRTPKEVGGVPPFGLDMNGILWLHSQLLRWMSAGGGIMYDSDFATNVAVGGYPKGAVLMRSDGAGFWISTTDNNTANPDTGGAGWQPAFNYGVLTVALTSSNVTPSVLDAAKPIIVLTGTLSASVQLILPSNAYQWLIINNTTGAYTVTVKTASGSGVVVSQGSAKAVASDGTNIIGINAQKASTAQVAAGSASDVYLSPANLNDVAKYVGDKLMPVGTLYGNAAVSTNPGTLLGFGTWVAIDGRFVAGYKSGDANFGTIGATGGAKTVTLAEANLAPHKHVVGVVDGTDGVPEWADPIVSSSAQKSNPAPGTSVPNARAKGRTETTGSGDPFDILPPFFVACLWYRTA